MSYTVHFAFAATPGQTVHGQLLDNAFSSSGSAITSGITEVGSNGHYGYVASISDAFEGFLKFYVSGDTNDVVAFFAITPGELSNPTTSANASAVWQYTLESGNPTNVQTAEEIVRVVLAALVGVNDSAYDWGAKSPSGAKTRVGGALDDDGKRTAVTLLDGS